MLNNAMSVVILAAGKGTRMYSDLPKVLHTLAGKAMVQHVIDAANELGAAHVHLVYGHGGDLLKQALKDDNLNWVLQAEQLGTGHAMQQAAPFFADDEDILMLYVLEVQPGNVTVLADTAIRGQDLDEARAMEAKRKAEEHISSSHGDVDYAQASAELAKAIAQLRVIELTKKAM